MTKDLELVAHWEDIVHEVFACTSRFPKAMRFVISNRMCNSALDIMSLLVEAQYTSARKQISLLERANMELTQLRVLLRISVYEKWMSIGGYEELSRKLDEAGKRMYAWKQKKKS